MIRTFISKLHRYTLDHRRAMLILLFFAFLMGMITFVNHLNFKTFSLDLGVYTNALWDYSHFQWNDSRTFLSQSTNLLHDHFDLYLIIFSPLSYLFGSYTLLIVQWLSILFGAAGFYKWMLSADSRSSVALQGLIYYLSFFGIYAALSFDYHSNVVASSLFPWFWMALEKGKWKSSLIWLFFILIGKENLSLWMAAVGLTSLFLISNKKLAGVITFISAVYFVLISQFIMPLMDAAEGKPMKFAYSVLGSDMKSALIHLFTHPIESLKLLFYPQFDIQGFEYAKWEFWCFLIGSGFWLIVKRPVFLIAFAPLILQKMFHDQPTLWGIEAHYNIEFLPLLGIMIFLAIAPMQSKTKVRLSWVVVLLQLGVTVRMMDHTEIWMDKTRLRIYRAEHYPNWAMWSEREKLIESIPKDAIVSASSRAVSHLALRDKCYTYPDVPSDVEYIVIIPDESISEGIKELEQPNWKVEHRSDAIWVLHRIRP